MPEAQENSDKLASSSKEQLLKTTMTSDESNPVDLPVIVLNAESPNGKLVKVEVTAADSVLDIRQFLLECPETCELTCYHMEYEGTVLNDYLELAEYPKLLNKNQPQTVKIIPGRLTLELDHRFTTDSM